jgi:nascent polypeptide-associated complex subunit alpha
MIPGMNQGQMQRMMKQMGMQSTEIEATEVIIKTADKTIVISGPQVSKIKMMGQETYQIVGGEVSEEELVDEVTISDDDVKMIMEQCTVSDEIAREALENANGDIAQAILDIQNEQ